MDLYSGRRQHSPDAGGVKLLVGAGAVMITAFILPFRSERGLARYMFQPGKFIEVHLDVLLSVGAALYHG